MSLDDMVEYYFNKNCTHLEIQSMLSSKHDNNLSISTIKRILYGMNLKRKNYEESDLETIVSAVVNEVNSDGYNLGYRALHQKLKVVYKLKVKRLTVYKVLSLADPEGVAERFGNRLRRRLYTSPGPNFVWHMDGWDKLKFFGFAVHGCVDGFSRYIIWLEVGTTNNNPKVTANYFLDSVQKLGYVPTLLRSDRGSENSLIGLLQIAFRTDHTDKLAGDSSFIQGKSMRNQRIESFWGRMRQHSMDYYIQFFKCMQQENLFDGSALHMKCLQFCFGPLVKNSLSITKKLWNQHSIRKQAAGQNVLHGKPYVLFNLPQKVNSKNYRRDVNVKNIPTLKSVYTVKSELVDMRFVELVKLLNIDIPPVSNVNEALSLYKEILKCIHEYDKNIL